jgi:hypothetical protein
MQLARMPARAELYAQAARQADERGDAQLARIARWLSQPAEFNAHDVPGAPACECVECRLERAGA